MRKPFDVNQALLFYVSNTIFHEDGFPGLGTELHNYGSDRHQETINYLESQGLIEVARTEHDPTKLEPAKRTIYKPTKKALRLRWWLQEKGEN